MNTVTPPADNVTKLPGCRYPGDDAPPWLVRACARLAVQAALEAAS